MSDAIREAIIDVLCSTRPMTAPQQADAILALAVLQSRLTATFVPDQTDDMIPAHFNVDECRGFRTGYNHLRSMLTAAPHPDAGKVVHDEG